MSGMPLGLVIEGAVAILLALTIGYCVVLNGRLKRLHADRDQLRQMVTDLVQATDLANRAIRELKTTAVETDLVLKGRLEEAERFGIELANHVTAGSAVMDRLARIASAARPPAERESAPSQTFTPAEPSRPSEASRLQAALEQLASRERARGQAA
ncbi:chemotaxis protein [Arsenicitalea aurantiaca]|uniref:Chemotaxis protein n=1 Tax=Arsenicitalea aurantiaca TaxID=1783274 RepID=A0A433XGF6_9HYPH|nr:DUF6468 domain-containing protein [Arsenicitalea aurantiaca]RUT33122.1 chemotaxis protein [Arsenicitalea aurantiaca]